MEERPECFEKQLWDLRFDFILKAGKGITPALEPSTSKEQRFCL